MKKLGLQIALLCLVIFTTLEFTFNAQETFVADETHSVDEGSEPLTRAEVIDLYNVEYNQENSLAVYTSDIDYNTPGTYQIRFEETDVYGSMNTYYSNLVVTDLLPIIELDSENVQTVGNKSPEAYDLISLFGLTATEIETGDLTTQVTVDDSQVVYNQVGHNQVTFTVTDDEGNSVSELGDLYFRQLAPEISGLEQTNTIVGTELTKQQLIDLFEISVIAEDGSVKIDVNDRDVNYYKVGSYPVTFTAEDVYGNKSETITLTLNVIPEPVELTLSADETHNVNEGTERLTRAEVIDLYNVVYDQENSLGVYQSDVDYTTPGSYQIKFEETDSNGNSKVVYSEMVVTDVQPTISLSVAHVQALVNDPIDLLEAFGVTATELQTGDMNEFVTVDDSAVDYMHVGHYPVYFTVSDDEGNTIIEEGDLYLRSDAPTIVADSEHQVEEGSIWTLDQLLTLYNVIATDTDGINYIDVNTSKVDFKTPGRYTITFTAYDIYGMKSEEYYSIIEVTDVLPTIDTDIDQVEVEAGTEIDIEDVFGVHVGGDYNEVIIDDSNVDYGVEGNYEVIITAADDEGNVVTKSIIITIIITESEGCLNNGGHTNNSHNCQDEDAVCNNNGSNDCLNQNN